MRIVSVVQRYGEEVAGGAEAYCRRLSELLVGRGHRVDVVTTCAQSYVDWANHYPAGTTELNGVRVHRAPVRHPRQPELFANLNHRILGSRGAVPLHVQEEWMRMQGPDAPGVGDLVSDLSADADVVTFFTYLYATTYYGIGPARAPVLLHPLAHDEPPLYVPLFELTVRCVDGYAFATPEEEDLVLDQFGVGDKPHLVVGIGTELDDLDADPGAFREQFGLGDRPYLVVVGRVDPGKGADEVHDYFATFKQRHPGPLALVVVGEPVSELPEHPDVVLTGFVDEDVKRSAIAGATCLVQPSYFESFSMVLTEAWAQQIPVLVQGRCDVLRGQVTRSGGGIPYDGYAEFEVALELLLDDADLRAQLGRAGRDYTERHYRWDAVLDRYERLLRRVSGT